MKEPLDKVIVKEVILLFNTNSTSFEYNADFIPINLSEFTVGEKPDTDPNQSFYIRLYMDDNVIFADSEDWDPYLENWVDGKSNVFAYKKADRSKIKTASLMINLSTLFGTNCKFVIGNRPNNSNGCYLTLRITENGLESCIDSYYGYTWGCKETPTSKVVSYCSFIDIESMNDYFFK